jgi:hypothetical protein
MTLTEDQIERRVERMTDNADRHYMDGTLSRTEYEQTMRDIAAWADSQYRANHRIA